MLLQAQREKKHLRAEVRLPRNLHERQLVEKGVVLEVDAVDAAGAVDAVDRDQEVAGIVVVAGMGVRMEKAATKSAL